MAFRVAVIGAGAMGRNHARVASEMPGVELAAVVDADASVAKQVAGSFHVPQLPLAEAMKDKSIDAFVVATPTSTHHDVALRAIEAGKHVLVEKPIALDEAQAKDLAARARKSGKTLAVGHVERHNPAVRYAREALQRGEWGKLITLATRRVSNLPGRIRDVGVILDIGIHDLDAVRYLAGKDPERVSADAGTFTEGLAYEDHAAILLSFAGGVTGLLEVNWLTPMKVRRLSITASEAFVEVDYMTQQLRVSTSTIANLNEANLFQLPLEFSERTITLRRQEPLRLELADFVEAAKTGRPPLVTAEDGLAVLRIANAAQKAARERVSVPV